MLSTSFQPLVKKLLVTLLLVIVSRIGSYIPIPGVDPFDENLSAGAGGVFGLLNVFTGGGLSRLSVFSLAIMPYITASIVIQLLTSASKTLENLKKEGEIGRRKINQYTRYLTVVLSVIQSYGLIQTIPFIFGGEQTQVSSSLALTFFAILSLTTGTVVLMWLAETIGLLGIGNGSSIIIFSGIVSALPSAIGTLLDLVNAKDYGFLYIVVVIFLTAALITMVIFFERAQRRVVVAYPRRQLGMKMTEAHRTHLPLKLNTSGVIPPIFASAVLLFPASFLQMAGSVSESYPWLQDFLLFFRQGSFAYIVLFLALIVFFAFFYTAVVFNSEETSEALRKQGGVIPGVRPGLHTAHYFDYILTRITLVGALYIGFVCLFPELLVSFFSVPFYLGGTGLLIVINVVLDTVTQVQTFSMSQRYQKLSRRHRVGGRS